MRGCCETVVGLLLSCYHLSLLISLLPSLSIISHYTSNSITMSLLLLLDLSILFSVFVTAILLYDIVTL